MPCEASNIAVIWANIFVVQVNNKNFASAGHVQNAPINFSFVTRTCQARGRTVSACSSHHTFFGCNKIRSWRPLKNASDPPLPCETFSEFGDKYLTSGTEVNFHFQNVHFDNSTFTANFHKQIILFFHQQATHIFQTVRTAPFVENLVINCLLSS